MGIIFFAIFQKTYRDFFRNEIFFLGGVLGIPPEGGNMTTTQKDKIRTLRLQGKGYTEIGNELGLSPNTVKTFCYRNELYAEALKNGATHCKNCGKLIKEKAKTRPRKFCCEACKMKFWNTHRYARVNDKIVEFTCVQCGKRFTDYAVADRKFCSLECYRERGEGYGK